MIIVRKITLTRTKLLLVVVLVLSSMGLGWWLGWAKSPSGQDVEEVASRFAVPSDWSVAEARVRNRSPLCIDIRCPSVYKRWEFSEPISREALVSAMSNAGWHDVHVDGDCRPASNRTGSVPTCHGDAVSNSARVDITISGPTSGARPYWAVLIVEER